MWFDQHFETLTRLLHPIVVVKFARDFFFFFFSFFLFKRRSRRFCCWGEMSSSSFFLFFFSLSLSFSRSFQSHLLIFVCRLKKMAQKTNKKQTNDRTNSEFRLLFNPNSVRDSPFFVVNVPPEQNDDTLFYPYGSCVSWKEVQNNFPDTRLSNSSDL